MTKSVSFPLISVLVPVYGTETYLANCLESIFAQDYPNLEIIVTDDASPRPGSGAPDCRSIVRNVQAAQRRSAVRLQYTFHRRNLGLVEARRTGFFASRGAYVLIVDSDDTLVPGAVSALYAGAVSSGADIVHGRAAVTDGAESAADGAAVNDGIAVGNGAAAADNVAAADEKLRRILTERARHVHDGLLDGEAVFNGFLCERNHAGMLWAKLYRRELWERAFERIPAVECTMGEDSLLYFFLSRYARRYAGITDTVYRYRMEIGVSKHSAVTDMAEWTRVCSAASVFTVLFSYMENEPVTDVQRAAVQRNCRSFLAKTIVRLRTCVPASLQTHAHDILCDYWGRDFVSRMEAAVAAEPSSFDFI